MKKDAGQFNWSKLPDGAEEVLGTDFWNDFQRIIPRRGPSLDMYETDTEAIIVMEFADPKSIQHLQIKQHGNDLTVSGNVPYLYPVKKEKLMVNERFSGPFERRITIPFPFSTNDVTAKYKNCTLEIRIQKSKTENRIPVQFEEEI